jgi:DNA repair ATPase RecN
VRLRLRNFKQYVDQEWTFGDIGLVRLKGKTGAGKSSLFDGIYDAMTNDGDGVTPWSGLKPISTELELPGIVLTRTHTPETLRAVINGKESQDAAAQEEFLKALGMTIEEIGASCYARQRMEGNILSMNPADQMRFIQRLAFGDQDPEIYKQRIGLLIDRRAIEEKTAAQKLEALRHETAELAQKIDGERTVIGPAPECPYTDRDWDNTDLAISDTDKELKDTVQKVQNLTELLKNPVYALRRTFNVLQQAQLESEDRAITEVLDLQTQKDQIKPWAVQTKEQIQRDLGRIVTKRNFLEWKRDVDALVVLVKGTCPNYDGKTPLTAFLASDVDSTQQRMLLIYNEKSDYVSKIADLRRSLEQHRCPSCDAALFVENGRLTLAEEACDRADAEIQIADFQSKITELEKIQPELRQHLSLSTALRDRAEFLKQKALKDPWPELLPAVMDAKQSELNQYAEAQLASEMKISQLDAQLEKISKDLQTSRESYQKALTTIEKYKDIPDEADVEKDRIATTSFQADLVQESIALAAKMRQINAAMLRKTEYEKKEQHIQELEKQLAAKQQAVDTQAAEVGQCQARYAGAVRLKEVSDAAAITAVESVVAAINNDAKQFLDSMFPDGDVSVRILTGITTKKGDERSKLGLEIIRKGHRVSRLKHLSGGEQDRIKLAFQLALAEIYGAPFIMIDEGFAGVDIEETLSYCMDTLKQVSRKRLILMAQHGVPDGIFDQIVELG